MPASRAPGRRVARPVRPDGTQEAEYLCELDLAEERLSSGFGGGRSPFDDFFSDFFGAARRRGGGRVDSTTGDDRSSVSTSRSSSATRRASCCSGQRRPRSSGAASISTRDHLLYAALQDDVVRHVLAQIDADPEAIAAQVEEEAERASEPTSRPRSLLTRRPHCSPRTRSRASSAASYVGPEHVLLALARDDESQAGGLLQRFGVSHTKLRGAVIRGVEWAAPPARHPTPKLDEYGRDLTQRRARASSTR